MQPEKRQQRRQSKYDSRRAKWKKGQFRMPARPDRGYCCECWSLLARVCPQENKLRRPPKSEQRTDQMRFVAGSRSQWNVRSLNSRSTTLVHKRQATLRFGWVGMWNGVL